MKSVYLKRPGVDVGCLDGVEEQFSYTHSLHVNEVRLEQSFRSLETLAAHFNQPPVRQLQTQREDTGDESSLDMLLLPSSGNHCQNKASQKTALLFQSTSEMVYYILKCSLDYGTERMYSYVPCKTPPARWSPAQASAPARCYSPRNTASPSSSSPSRSPRSG